jgi:hypothetical protein
MKPINHIGTGTLWLCAIAWLAISPAASAQVQEPMGTFPPDQMHRMQPPYMQRQQPLGSGQQSSGPRQQPPGLRQQHPAPPAQAQAITQPVPPSLLDKPPQPAKIDLAPGQLSIHADNSSLIDIMHKLTADAGMTIDGLNKDQRVFGSYGPGDPQEVISELLDGTGYNVVMVGRTDVGTPKQVTLTPRAGGVPNGPAGIQPQAMNQISQDDDVDDEPQPQPLVANPVEQSPQQIPPQQPAGGVRTPQQMLQELQQMRQQQLQQQSQPLQPVPPQQQ